MKLQHPLLYQSNKNTAEIEKINEGIERINEKIYEKDEKIKNLNNDISELTDRQMRSTLIIHGIPQSENKKSWDDTANTFASYLAANLGWEKQAVLEDIERIHRGTKKGNSKRQGPLPIFVKFISWKSFQNVLSAIIKVNKDRQISVTAHQMYSKQTQIRQNFKNDPNKKDWSCYIKYPGKLLVKKSRNGIYESYEQ